MLKYELNNGIKIPAIGFGTWSLSEGKEAVEAIGKALAAGYRLIDTAKIYGNEKSIGEALRNSDVPREDVFVTTKLQYNEHGYDSSLRAFGGSLSRLGLEYIDLYLIHWPGHSSQKRQDSWRALEKIHSQGKAKAIGVSNYELRHLEELLEKSNLVPAVNQIEFHPFIYDKQAPILEFCKVHDIVVEAYSPLNRGHNMHEPTLEKVAKQHGKSVAQVMLKWAIQHGTVPIPKSVHPVRIGENLEVFDFELTKDEMQTINQLGKGKSALPFYVKLLK